MTDVPSAPPAGRPRANRAGSLGLACGLLALAAALVPGWVAPYYDPPGKSIHHHAADWLERLRDQAAAAVGGERLPPPEAAPPNPWRDRRIALAARVLALGALACAVLAFVRREEPRLVACGVALGAGAIAPQHLVTAIMILVFAVTAVALAGLAKRG